MVAGALFCFLPEKKEEITMPSNLNLDYFYGTETERYNFCRIPKTLLTDPHYKGVSMLAP